jgi:hypothetical protein
MHLCEAVAGVREKESARARERSQCEPRRESERVRVTGSESRREGEQEDPKRESEREKESDR